MTAIISRLNYFQQIIEILVEIADTITLKTDVVWTGFNTSEELLATIAADIEKLKLQDYEILKKLGIMFAPTGTYQELSISNSWGDRYLVLAQQFDYCFQKLKDQ